MIYDNVATQLCHNVGRGVVGGRGVWQLCRARNATLIVEQVSLKTGQLVHARRSILIRKLSAKELRELKRDK